MAECCIFETSLASFWIRRNSIRKYHGSQSFRDVNTKHDLEENHKKLHLIKKVQYTGVFVQLWIRCVDWSEFMAWLLVEFWDQTRN